MAIHSGGILLYKFVEGRLQVMLAHPGGPFWAKKDAGSWSIPKGQLNDDEEPLAAAKREFNEETGHAIEGNFIALGDLKQHSGKIVHAWAIESDLDVATINSNTFSLEWPKKSGKVKEYPEIDRAAWFDVNDAKLKILKGQAGFLDRLIAMIGYAPVSEADSSNVNPK
jgi:predicted NUDIX family NTP pyrophosphohydrolase